MGDRAQIWRDTQILVINYVLVRTSRICLTHSMFGSQKRCISMIYLCNFKNIVLFISGYRYFCVSSCLFYLSFNSDFYVSKIMHL